MLELAYKQLLLYTQDCKRKSAPTEEIPAEKQKLLKKDLMKIVELRNIIFKIKNSVDVINSRKYMTQKESMSLKTVQSQ